MKTQKLLSIKELALNDLIKQIDKLDREHKAQRNKLINLGVELRGAVKVLKELLNSEYSG